MERKDGWVSCQRCCQAADAAKASADKAAADRSLDSGLHPISPSGSSHFSQVSCLLRMRRRHLLPRQQSSSRRSSSRRSRPQLPEAQHCLPSCSGCQGRSCLPFVSSHRSSSSDGNAAWRGSKHQASSICAARLTSWQRHQNTLLGCAPDKGLRSCC